MNSVKKIIMKNKISDYKKLDSWAKSINFATLIYKETESFPKHELFGLVNQIRRAVVSISSNIAEGSNRGSNKEFVRFLYIALGSASEVDTQLIIAKELNYHNNEQLFVEIDEIKALIYGLIRYLEKKEGEGNRRH